MASTKPPAVRPDDESSDEPEKNAGSSIAEAVLAILIAIILTSVLRVFVAQVFQVPSGSMEHTLVANDRIIALRPAGYERGDVVVFEDPAATWMGEIPPSLNPVRRALEAIYVLPDSSQGYLVKRILGTGGDRVACCDAGGLITVNGVPIDETEYLFADETGATVQPSEVSFDVTVPEGHLFVLGDNRNRSADSRTHLCDVYNSDAPQGYYAFVPEDNVVGPVVAIAYPFDRISRFHHADWAAYVPEPVDHGPSQPVIHHSPC